MSFIASLNCSKSQLTHVSAVLRNILNVAVHDKFVFSMKRPLASADLTNSGQFPRFFILSVVPDK